MFFVTLLNHFYWVSGATIGGLVGSLIHFNTDGISFVMTSMFVVIFMEQWMKEKHHVSAYIGLGVAAVCLILFGADSFMIPTMIAIIVFLAAIRKPLVRSEVTER
jgi:4-azaleucine resistance transporter AzlC